MCDPGQGALDRSGIQYERGIRHERQLEEVRIPKSEGRKKSQYRILNSRSCEKMLRFVAASGFDFRVSFGFRYSGFGLLISRRLPRLAPFRAVPDNPIGQCSLKS